MNIDLPGPEVLPCALRITGLYCVKAKSNMAADGNFGPKLQEIFDDIWKSYEFLESTDEPTVSEIVQV